MPDELIHRSPVEDLRLFGPPGSLRVHEFREKLGKLHPFLGGILEITAGECQAGIELLFEVQRVPRPNDPAGSSLGMLEGESGRILPASTCPIGPPYPDRFTAEVEGGQGAYATVVTLVLLGRHFLRASLIQEL